MRKAFKDLKIGESFHTGFCNGIGVNSKKTMFQFYTKTGKKHATLNVNKYCDQFNELKGIMFSPYTSVFCGTLDEILEKARGNS
jgi:hypothetical protein